jgi:hypothetical protein
MSDPETEQQCPEADDAPSQGPGPNLILIYSLIALAMVVAIGLALTIVLPFYHRR